MNRVGMLVQLGTHTVNSQCVLPDVTWVICMVIPSVFARSSVVREGTLVMCVGSR